MATIGSELFNRNGPDDDQHSDIWDDTALIEAYDNAVSIVKERMSLKKDNVQGESSSIAGETPPSTKKKHRKHNRHKRNKTQPQQNKTPWRVGQHCQAVFSEDGDVYEAVVKTVDAESGTCVVKYLGYGNEEEQRLEDLLPPSVAGSAAGSLSALSDRASEGEGGVEWQPHSRTSRRAHPRQSMHPASHHTFSPHMPAMPPPTFQPPFGMPPMGVPGMAAPGTFSSFPTFPGSSVPPMMPPAPPDLDDIDEAMCSDREALYTMLMAWYMSGYHTGYYTGLQQSRKHPGAGQQRTSSSAQREDHNTTTL